MQNPEIDESPLVVAGEVIAERMKLATLTGKEAVRLNLRIANTPSYRYAEWWPIYGGGSRWNLFKDGRITQMAQIGDRFTATIKPTNAKGDPAPVTDVLFEELTDQYDLFDVSADGLSATFVAVKPGTGAVVTVTAKSKSGVVLADTKPLPDVEPPAPDEEAVALNLTVA